MTLKDWLLNGKQPELSGVEANVSFRVEFKGGALDGEHIVITNMCEYLEVPILRGGKVSSILKYVMTDKLADRDGSIIFKLSEVVRPPFHFGSAQ